jgi:hypothetical protein
MHRLVPAILDAWRDAEREMAERPEAALAERIHVLRNAYQLATAPEARREDIVRLLDEHGLSDIVPNVDPDDPLGQPA